MLRKYLCRMTHKAEALSFPTQFFDPAEISGKATMNMFHDVLETRVSVLLNFFLNKKYVYLSRYCLLSICLQTD